MANRRFIDFPIAASVGNNDIVLIWQDGLNKQTTKATLLQGSPQSLAGLTDVDIAALTNGQILQYNSTTSKWENVDRTDIFLSQLGDVTIVAPSNGQVLVYNSSTSKWENSSGGYVPYTGAVTTVNLGAQTIQAGSFVKTGGTAAQFLKANGSVDSTAYGTGSVTSVALTMPSAFSVANSPVTTAGTLAVTGAGLVSQYIRGDGSLADFPATTGGGSSVSYYLNGSVSQGTIGGVAYKELNRTPVFGAGTDISISADGYIASFITDALDPNKLLIPAGNWNLETYFSASSNGGSPSFYVELYKYNGTTFTLIATSSSAPELIAFGTNLNPYYSTLAVPETVLALTDRLALRYYVTHSGRTITLHTENNHLCQVITTFTTGLTALNGLTNQVQFFAVGTSGTDFAISSVTDTHTFNLPTASATNRGALSSADWTTFNNKTSNLGTVTSVGLSSATSGVTIGSTPITTSGTITLAIATASGSQNGLLSSTDWSTFNGKQNALTNPVTGTGSAGQVAYWSSGSAITGESNLFWDATNDRLGIGTITPAAGLEIVTDSGTTNALRVVSNRAFNSNTDVAINFRYKYDSINFTTGGLIVAAKDDNTSGSQSGNLQFYTNNAGSVGERIRIFSDGNVLIQSGGTFTNAGYKLDVNGTGRFSGTLRSNDHEIKNSANAETLDLFLSPSTLNAFIDYPSGRSLTIRNKGSLSTFTLASTGAATFSSSVTLTSGLLSVDGFANKDTNYITLRSGFSPSDSGGLGFKAIDHSGSSTDGLACYGHDGISLYTAQTERMRITSGGNVGIGTASPSANLHLSSGADTGIVINSSAGAYTGYLNIHSAGGGASVIRGIGGTPFLFEVNGTERMRISSGGDIGIGADSNSLVRLLTRGKDAGTTNYAFIAQNSSTTNLFLIRNDGAASFFSLGTGTVTATGGTLSTVSDSSYKIDDGYIDSALEKVLSLKPRYFYWNEKSGLPKDIRQLGFYAQEVNEALGEEAANKPKNKNTPYGISDRSIIAMLTKAIQELKQEIDTLKN